MVLITNEAEGYRVLALIGVYPACSEEREMEMRVMHP
jgi:hypothetical protein